MVFIAVFPTGQRYTWEEALSQSSFWQAVSFTIRQQARIRPINQTHMYNPILDYCRYTEYTWRPMSNNRPLGRSDDAKDRIKAAINNILQLTLYHMSTHICFLTDDHHQTRQLPSALMSFTESFSSQFFFSGPILNSALSSASFVAAAGRCLQQKDSKNPLYTTRPAPNRHN